MQNRKRTHMAFRPCVSQSTLEDRLVLKVVGNICSHGSDRQPGGRDPSAGSCRYTCPADDLRVVDFVLRTHVRGRFPDREQRFQLGQQPVRRLSRQ